MSAFSQFVGKLEKKGYSKDSATKIAAKVGDEKYGKSGMAKKAAAARESKVCEAGRRLREAMFPHLRQKRKR
jgi:hypothetical protein